MAAVFLRKVSIAVSILVIAAFSELESARSSARPFWHVVLLVSGSVDVKIVVVMSSRTEFAFVPSAFISEM